MKVRIFMATLAVTLMLGVQGYANPCSCVDPCGATCDHFAAKGGLFSGLKRLVSGGHIAHCDPCDAVLACNPCDALACDPCDTVCNLPRLGLGSRLRNLLAAPAYCNPCNGAGNCYDASCDPCNGAGNCFDGCGDNYCAPKRFTFRGFNPFRGILNRGCYTDCDPCNGAGNCFDRSCDPCNGAANCFDRNCHPCNGAANCFDRNCDPCNGAANCFDRFCDPCNGAGNCFDGCGDTYCGPRGHLFDLPRFSLANLFNRARFAKCSAADCGPCDNVRPCNGVCCR